MTRVLGLFSIGSLLLAGCGQEAAVATNAPTAEEAASAHAAAETPSAHEGTPGGTESAAAGFVAITDGTAKLDPSNTRIGFVGTHTGDKPDPRVGNFEKFTGTAEVDAAAKTLKSVTVDIETASLKTPIGNLTAHLNSPDFFDTREFPKATFKSKKIADEGGETKITGDLTLHGVTKEISFPASVTITDAGVSVKADFTIDRTEFGIGEPGGRVEQDVQIDVSVGDNSPPETDGQPAG